MNQASFALRELQTVTVDCVAQVVWFFETCADVQTAIFPAVLVVDGCRGAEPRELDRLRVEAAKVVGPVRPQVLVLIAVEDSQAVVAPE